MSAELTEKTACPARPGDLAGTCGQTGQPSSSQRENAYSGAVSGCEGSSPRFGLRLRLNPNKDNTLHGGDVIERIFRTFPGLGRRGR